MTTEIFTTGFPRSGSTWLNRILCDLFDAPLQNVPRTEKLWDFTEVRDNKYIIRKTHWYRQEYEKAIPDDGYLQPGHRIIWIHRDPRDMVVSTMYYLNSNDLIGVIRKIDNPESAEQGFSQFVNGWTQNPPDYSLSYNSLHKTPELELLNIYKLVTGTVPTLEKIGRVIERQKFDQWKHKFPHSMRKGIVGDWRNHFNRESAELMDKLFGKVIIGLGYETDNSWISTVN